MQHSQALFLLKKSDDVRNFDPFYDKKMKQCEMLKLMLTLHNLEGRSFSPLRPILINLADLGHWQMHLYDSTDVSHKAHGNFICYSAAPLTVSMATACLHYTVIHCTNAINTKLIALKL